MTSGMVAMRSKKIGAVHHRGPPAIPADFCQPRLHLILSSFEESYLQIPGEDDIVNAQVCFKLLHYLSRGQTRVSIILGDGEGEGLDGMRLSILHTSTAGLVAHNHLMD